MTQAIYRFGATGSGAPAADKTVLGGKGWGLAEMSALGLPVPPGFTITTDVCNQFHSQGPSVIDALWPAIVDEMARLATHFGYVPLVSVRSGAPVSMPGMMNTILNVGITTDSLPFWVSRLGERAALDSQRRLIQMLGETALGVPMKLFDDALAAEKAYAGVSEDKDLQIGALDALVGVYLGIVQTHTGNAFPDTLEAQLRVSIEAVFKSWNTERAVLYRKQNSISDSMGTAVNVQAMVFGNLNDKSGSGVLFTRNPSTGARVLYGEFLPNAQGEDVVAGIRTPLKLSEMAEVWPGVAGALRDRALNLELHYRDMQDIEFTVQDGELFVLQTRSGKRTAQAAIRIAVEMADEGLITRREALSRVTPEQFKIAKRPKVDPSFKKKPTFTGLPACGGVAVGTLVFSADRAVELAATGKSVILVSEETTPDDYKGMVASKAVITSKGGSTSHAAVVARSMDLPCVVGCNQLHITETGALVGTLKLLEGTEITVCGDSGRVWVGVKVPVSGGDDPNVADLLDWLMGEYGLTRQIVDPAEVGVLRYADLFALGSTSDGVLKGLVSQPAGILVDEAEPVVVDDDMGLWDVCGDFESSVARHQLGLAALSPSQLLGEVPAAATVGDLLSGSSVRVTDAFIDDCLGGADVWFQILPFLRQSGVLSRVVGPVVPRDYAAFRLLGR